jgi:hypothetical protein
MRRSSLFVLYIALLCGLLLLSQLDAAVRSRGAEEQVAQMREQVTAWELTDLTLFTEARYTRHLSQADYHTPFQDHPFALEHFPSGSLIMPPALLDKRP